MKELTNTWKSTLTVFDDSVKLNHTNYLMFGVNRGEKMLLYTDISSIEFYEAKGGISFGYIQFNVPGHIPTKPKNPGFDEFAFAFYKKDMEEAKQAYELILEKWKKAKSSIGAPVVQQALTPIDEIKKLKELLELDIISQEEFDSKKQELLKRI